MKFMENKILVIVPVLNLWDRYTRACLESVFANQPSVPMNVMLIDNASNDGTTEKAYAWRPGDPGFHIIRNEDNKGCGGGWNQGIEWGLAAGFTHFLVLNNDTLIGPKTVEGLYQRLVQTDVPVLLSSAVDVSGEVRAPEELLQSDHAVNNKVASEAPHPNFSCFMISKETVDKVGLFDEAFWPAYFEDNDYHRRLKLVAGDASGVATTTAVFYHFGSRTQNEALGKPIVPGSKFEENRGYFARKWGGNPGSEIFTNPFNDPSKDIKHVTRR